MSRSTITGTSQNVGNKIGDIPSVKLHAPPGGASSFSLGWGSEPAPAPVTHGIRREYHGGSDVFAAAAPPAAAYGGGAYGAAPPAAPSAMRMAGSDITNTAQQQYGAGPADPTAPPMGAPALGGAVTSSSNAYATGANQNCGNFLTDRRTTKVHAPPGGRSQITFG